MREARLAVELGPGTCWQQAGVRDGDALRTAIDGVFRTLKHATPHLERSRGHVTIVASALSFMPFAGSAPYTASKAGAEMPALAYRQEVAHLGITVGVVHPSWIDTGIIRGADADIPSFRTLRSRVYVPRAVLAANWLQAALDSPMAWPWTRRSAARAVPAFEREVEALGRNDQLVPKRRTEST